MQESESQAPRAPQVSADVARYLRGAPPESQQFKFLIGDWSGHFFLRHIENLLGNPPPLGNGRARCAAAGRDCRIGWRMERRRNADLSNRQGSRRQLDQDEDSIL